MTNKFQIKWHSLQTINKQVMSLNNSKIRSSWVQSWIEAMKRQSGLHLKRWQVVYAGRLPNTGHIWIEISRRKWKRRRKRRKLWSLVYSWAFDCTQHSTRHWSITACANKTTNRYFCHLLFSSSEKITMFLKNKWQHI